MVGLSQDFLSKSKHIHCTKITQSTVTNLEVDDIIRVHLQITKKLKLIFAVFPSLTGRR